MAEVPQRKHWRLPCTPRMFLFIEMTGRKNKRCSDRDTVFGQALGFRKRRHCTTEDARVCLERQRS